LFFHLLFIAELLLKGKLFIRTVNGHKPILFTFLLRLPKLFSVRISNENRINRRSENDQWTAKSQNHLKRPKISKFLVKKVTLHFRVFSFNSLNWFERIMFHLGRVESGTCRKRANEDYLFLSDQRDTLI
jgi:hypothetical protein